MRKLFLLILLSAFILLSGGRTFAGDPDGDNKVNKQKKEKLEKDYTLKKKEFDILHNSKPIDIYIDYQLGLGSGSANISNALTSNAYDTKSVLSFNTGGIVHISFFEFISFTTGVSFVGKSFKFTPPQLDTAAINKFGAGEKSLKSTYLNIPLYLDFGGMLTDKIGLTFTGGPYLGIRLNSEDYDGLAYKNFDLGLSGTLTGNYVIAYPLNLILGVNFQFGGLNNLASTKFIDHITTQNFNVFTGLRLWF